MLKIKILSVGKTKEAWLKEAISEYEKRLRGRVKIDFIWAKNDNELAEAAMREPSILALDPNGAETDSEVFSAMLLKRLELGRSQVSFVIGGASGLPRKIKDRSDLISLSRLTFTHQITRLVLVEQIYRAFEIYKGSGYHK